MKTETLLALRLVDEGKTPYMAAKMAGIAQSTVARAIERQQRVCPTCGHIGKWRQAQEKAAK